MKLETFFEKFDQFADAPAAVAKMRELILQLAVQGQLVSQDSKEEPASLILERCRAHGRRSTQFAKAESVLDQLNSDGLVLPLGWAWACNALLGDTGPRNDIDDETEVSFAPMTLIPTDYRIRPEFERRRWGEIKKGYTHFANGDVAIAKITPCFQNGKACVFADLLQGVGAGTTELHVLRPYPHVVDPHFMLLVYKSPAFVDGGVATFSGTAGQQRVSNDYFRYRAIALPPLAEQKRIVAKVDELMALCDRLEAQLEERETRHATLARASLARFAESPTPENLQYLFHPSYAIAPADLRKSILTLAVQGKLVPQDSNDEPAEGMLARIEAEKKRLADTGELKADKKAWVNSSPNPPHDIPESWCWVRLQDVFEISRGGSPRPAGDPRFFGGPIPWITVGEVTKDSAKYLTQTATGLTEEGSERSRFINPGDLLLTNSGATLGVPKISKIRGCMNDGVAVLRLFHSCDLNEFAYLYLTHQTASFRNVNQGMGQPNLNTPIIAGWFFPLPPLAEQRRIVAKVEQLMALVDALETQLAASRDTAADLLSALVAELTASE